MNHRHPAARFLRLLTLLLLSFALTARPAMAQSILRDAETEAFFKDISKPLIIAAGLDPNNVDIVLIGDPSINAFVAGGQVVRADYCGRQRQSGAGRDRARTWPYRRRPHDPHG